MSKMYYIIALLIMWFGVSCKDQLNEKSSVLDTDKKQIKDTTTVLNTKETTALYNNLNEISKKGVMFGHQDAVAYGIGWRDEGFKSDVQMVCGDFPAVFGWDIGCIGDVNNIDGVPFKKIAEYIIEVYERGGINTISWHIRNPVTGGDSWNTSKAVAEILPGGDYHVKYLDKLDLVVDFLSLLKTEDNIKVPIIFRPFHEMTGSWFWWGKKYCTPDEYIALWQLTVNYLREKNKVNHVLYCYSTDIFESEDEYMERYPGDDYVDMIGFDDYHSISSVATYNRLSNRLEILTRIAGKRGKVAALTETGLETIPISDWWTEILLKGIYASVETSNIAYVLVWRNGRPDHYYAPYPGHSSSKNFNEFYNDSRTLFLNDLKGVYN